MNVNKSILYTDLSNEFNLTNETSIFEFDSSYVRKMHVQSNNSILLNSFTSSDNDQYVNCYQLNSIIDEDLVINDSISSILDSLISINDSLSLYINNLDQIIDSLQSSQENCTIQEVQIPLLLSGGWTFFGFTCIDPMDVPNAFNSIVEEVVIVKDADGSAYLPTWGFNGIGDLIYSRGYQIKTTEAVLGFSFCPTIIVSEEENSLQYQIGDQIEGGIVFYIDDTGEHGLIAAMEDLDSTYEWGCYSTPIIGADGESIGTGLQNTLDIVASCPETPIAVSIALNSIINSYSDWYLPSKDELLEMYNRIGEGAPEGNIGGFSNSGYWSSSEINSNLAWYVYFGNGDSFSNVKYANGRVRVIRAF